MFSEDIRYILPNSHFMFLIDMKYISNMFDGFLRGSSSFLGARLFENWQHFGFPQLPISTETLFVEKVPGIFLDFVRHPGVSKEK